MKTAKIPTKQEIAKIKSMRRRNFSLAFISTVLEINMEDVLKHTKDIEIDLRTIHTKLDPHKDMYPCYTKLFSELEPEQQEYYNSLYNPIPGHLLFNKAVMEYRASAEM